MTGTEWVEHFQLLFEGVEPAFYYEHTEEGLFSYLSPGTERATGHAPAALLGKHYETLTPRDQGVLELTEHTLTSDGPHRYRVRAIHRDGHEIILDVSEVATADRRGVRGFAREVTRQHHNEEALRLLQDVLQKIATADTLEQALEAVLQRLSETSGWCVGEAWMPTPDGSCLERRATWAHCKQRGIGFLRDTEGLRFAPGEGLVGRCWARAEPQWREGLHDTNTFLSRPAAEGAGLNTGVAVPVITDGEVVCILCFFGHELRPADRRMVRLVSTIAAQLGVLFRRKTAETALRSREQELSSLIENSPDIILMVGPRGFIRAISPAVERVLGHRALDLVGSSAAQLLAPEERERARALLEPGAAAADLGAMRKLDLRLLDRDGRSLMAEVTAKTVVDGEGEPLSIIICHDVSERRAAEDALRESEARYRAVFDLSTDAIFVSTPEGRVLATNPAFSRLTGWEPDSLHQRNAGVVWADPGRRADFVHRMAIEGRVLNYPLRILRADGAVRECLASASTRYDEEGEALAFHGIIRDVTEEKRAADALRESEARYRQIFERPTTGKLLVSARTGEILDANPAACRLYGYARDIFCGLNIAQISVDPPETALSELLRASEDESHVVMTHRTHLGEPRTVEVHIGRIQVQAQDVLYLLLFDITRQRRIEEQAQSAQKLEAVGRLAGGVAHDFNNVLTAISGFGRLLEAEGWDSEKRAHYLEEIQAATRRAGALTHQLLAFSRRQVMQPETLQMGEVLAEMDGMLRRLLREDVELELRLAADLPAVHADASHLQQIVLNLTLNAREAMPHGGHITLRAAPSVVTELPSGAPEEARPGTYVVLSVEDRGEGIAPGVLDRIFEPFFTTKQEGTGLGLSTVYGVAQQNRGWVSVQSAVGQGSCFSVFLPAAPQAAEPKPSARAVVEAPSGSGTILLVEDEAPVRRVTRRILERKGYEVLDAATPAEGLQIFEERADDLVLLITDIVLPGMSGPQMAQRIAARRPDLRVLYMTGYTDNPALLTEVQRPGDGFIAKPFTLEQVAEKVYRMIEPR
jgi:PAS domain S-box-containing protein